MAAVMQLVLAAVLLFGGVSAATAQGYPNRPVRVVVGFPAGGPTDVIARTVAQKLSDALGQQFFVENIGGAGGNTASGQVALRYCGRNPNGSVDDIAGVCDTTGAVMGLMPHPENHIVSRQHPLHRRAAAGTANGSANHLGLQIFQNGVRYAEAR